MQRLPVAAGPRHGRPGTSPSRWPDAASRLVARLGGLVLLLGLAACGPNAPTRPNLILITVDRLATERLGCFGGPDDAGRSICALAEGGTLFAWAATPGLGEASGAATALTGRSQAQHLVRDDGRSFLADHQDTIVEALSREGYATAAFVASARVNHSRRLDQGFDHYDDRLTTQIAREGSPSVELSAGVQSWIADRPSPWFVWIHARRDAGPRELDRLISRLSRTLEGTPEGPGILFVALRGEVAAAGGESENGPAGTSVAPAGIEWSSHRVPMIWRPPSRADGTQGAARVSRRLATLVDIATTLGAVAHVRTHASDTSGEDDAGRDLRQLALPIGTGPPPEERFVLLQSASSGAASGAEPGAEVGLATDLHLYRRRASPLDGSGRSVPTESLRALEARYAVVPQLDPIQDPSPRDASLSPGVWREDILRAQSPVPRLEFHLARRLARAAGETTE